MAPHRNSPSGRTGHVSVSYKDCVYVWGGYKETYEHNAHVYFASEEIWIFHSLTETWSCRKCSIVDGPPGMSGSTAAMIGEYMYVFGGYSQDPEGSANELYRLDLEEYTWKHLKPTGQAPFPVDKTVSWQNDGKFYTFGGFGSPTSMNSLNAGFQFVFDQVVWKGWTNQFYEYDPDKNSWAVPSFEGELPLPRAAHATAVIGKKVYIFGGRHNHVRMNDLHCCDMSVYPYRWSGNMTVRGPVPEGRSWHSLTAISNRFLLLYGGFSHDCHPLGDCWIYDTKNSLWQQLQLNFFKCRLWHSASLTSCNEVMIFGGCSSNILDDRRTPVSYNDHENEPIFIRISPKSLYRICLDRVGELQELSAEWCTLPHSVQAILNIRYCTTKATSLDGS